jgi:hypothetical protein
MAAALVLAGFSAAGGTPGVDGRFNTCTKAPLTRPPRSRLLLGGGAGGVSVPEPEACLRASEVVRDLGLVFSCGLYHCGVSSDGATAGLAILAGDGDGDGDGAALRCLSVSPSAGPSGL